MLGAHSTTTAYGVVVSWLGDPTSLLQHLFCNREASSCCIQSLPIHHSVRVANVALSYSPATFLYMHRQAKYVTG